MESVEMAYREMMSVVLEKQAGVTAEVDFMRLMECLSHRSHSAGRWAICGSGRRKSKTCTRTCCDGSDFAESSMGQGN